MSELEQLEKMVESLPPEVLAKFSAWFMEFDWQLWDVKIETDLYSGKLEQLPT